MTSVLVPFRRRGPAMNRDLERELQGAASPLFRDLYGDPARPARRGCEFADGWYRLLERLCQELEPVARRSSGSTRSRRSSAGCASTPAAQRRDRATHPAGPRGVLLRVCEECADGRVDTEVRAGSGPCANRVGPLRVDLTRSWRNPVVLGPHCPEHARTAWMVSIKREVSRPMGSRRVSQRLNSEWSEL